MQYTYEFEMWRGERYWCIEPFGLGGITQGADVQDACESAADLLREIVRDFLMNRRELPAPTFGNEVRHEGVRVIVSVDAALSDIPRVTAAEAAKALGVNRSRITAMLADGKLDGWREGRNTWVTQESLNARLKEGSRPGRPRKREESLVG